MSNIDSNKKIDNYQLGGMNTVVDTIWLKHSNNSQGSWIIKIKEAVRLHEYLKKLQPKHILELGTGIGCSTEIMAFTCPDASIYTLEQSQKCIDVAKTLISEKLQEKIYFKYLPAKITKPIYEVNPFVNWLIYSGEHDWLDYDFILIDGPGPIMVGLKNPDTNEVWKVLAELPGADLIFLLPKIKEGTIIYIDHRSFMIHLFIRHLSYYLEVLESTKEHTIFRRTKELLKEDLSDLKNSDMSYQALLRHGYFEQIPQEQQIHENKE